MNKQVTCFMGFRSITTGTTVTVWSGSNEPVGTESDVVDAGAGNDCVIASAGDDRVQGGVGDDQIDGLGGNDVLEGGEGKDNIQADGITKAGFMNSVAAQYHGADFVDGGAGDDSLSGGGGSGVIYGGPDNDRMWGDASGKTSDADYLELAYQGNDYLDGEDGNDYIEGGGRDDMLLGGDGTDTHQLTGNSGHDIQCPVAPVVPVSVASGADINAMQFIAACAYPIRTRGRFDSKPRVINDVAWEIAA